MRAGSRGLTAKAAEKMTTPGIHAAGVQGLFLQVNAAGARSWVFRYRRDGKRRTMGLGSASTVSLADARALARDALSTHAKGLDPIAERDTQRSARAAASLRGRTFDQVAAEYIAAHGAAWKNAKHAQQWAGTLGTYASPVLGRLQVGDVAKEHVLQVLRPLWTSKPETATRVRSRIELVLSYAMQAGYRPEALNPARWRGGLDKLLPMCPKATRVKHHRALPVAEVGAFMVRLRAVAGMGARALEFAILTAARSGEVRGMVWSEVDLDAAVWTVPGERMKMGLEHRVPLAAAAVELLRGQPRTAGCAYVFPSARQGALSDMTLSAVTRRLGVDAVPHGFRSTFRDWAGERTTYPRDLAEQALAHAIENKVEAAYRRGDMFDRRVPLMNDWAAFLSTVEKG